MKKMGKYSKKRKSDFSFNKTKQAVKINPFEIRVNKQKHDVLGRKKKRDRGLPGIARNKAVKKREATILQEYLSKNKNSKFLDKRIGENVHVLDKEDKMMARFSRELKKRYKKSSVYNLNEDEELTHLGRSIGEIDKYDDPHSESEDDEGRLAGGFVHEVHFGGFDGKTGEQVKKTHKERMDDLISESKRRKHEKKVANEANVDLTEKLDQEWKSIANLMNKSKKVEEMGKSIDDYDLKVRELKFEVKGKPSDRLKSAEEIAAEENEKLRKLEEERIRRMIGDTSPSWSSRNLERSHMSADDLYDGFSLQDDSLAESTDPNNQDEKNSMEEETYEDSSDDSDASDSYSDVESDDAQSDDEKVLEPSSRISKGKVSNQQNLPYVFPVPSSLDEFLEMVSKHTSSDQAMIVDRIIKCNHPSLGEDNRKKLETFFAILIQYVHDVGSDDESDVKLLELLNPHFLTLLRLSKKVMSESLLDVVKELQEKFQKGAKRNSERHYPDLGTLYLFKIISLLYPTSDYRHPVVTPAMIFMSQLLTKCRLNSYKDVSSCLFLCEMFFEYVALSKRFVPEAIHCLHHLLRLITGNHSEKWASCISISQHHTTEFLFAGKFNLLESIHSYKKKISEETKIMLVLHTVQLITKFAKMYKELPSFSEVFHPILHVVEKLPSETFSEELKTNIHELKEQLKKPHFKFLLHLEKKKPKSLKLYEPKYQAVFTGRKEHVGSKKKLERQKLVHKYKQELKGAMREIRQDNQFLARRQLHEQLQKDEKRKRKVKELYAELAQQEGDFKRMKKKGKLLSL